MFGDDLLGNTFNMIMNVSLDAVILLFVFGVVLLYVWRAGKKRSITLLLALIITSEIYQVFTNTSFYDLTSNEEGSGFVLNCFVFIFLTYILFLTLKCFVRRGYSSQKNKKLLQILILTFAIWGLLFSYLYHILDIGSFHDFSSFADNLFASSQAFFLWYLFTVSGLFFVHRLQSG